MKQTDGEGTWKEGDQRISIENVTLKTVKSSRKMANNGEIIAKCKRFHWLHKQAKKGQESWHELIVINSHFSLPFYCEIISVMKKLQK